MGAFERAIAFLHRIFKGQTFWNVDEERVVPLSTVPPTESREHVVAIAVKRDGGRLAFRSILSRNEMLSDEEKRLLASQYGELRKHEDYLFISVVGLFFVRNSPRLLVQMTMPDEDLTQTEAQDLGSYCFELMNGRRGDLFLASVSDRNLDKSRCYALSRASDGGQWAFRRVKSDVLSGFQIDSPGIFADERADPRWQNEELPIKIITGKHRPGKQKRRAGFIAPKDLVTAVFGERGFTSEQLQGFSIEVPEKGVLTRIYHPRYIVERRLILSVYSLESGELEIYNDRCEPRGKKVHPKFILNEIDEMGVPYVSDLVTISHHWGDNLVIQRRQSIPIVLESTPAPVRRRSTDPT